MEIISSDENTSDGNPNSDIWCNDCGDQRHINQDICPNEIFCLDFSAKTVECKDIEVKANHTERILFEINGLPLETFSVWIKSIKRFDGPIHVEEKRELVTKNNQISVNFKFMGPMSLNTRELSNLFVCEVSLKLNDENLESNSKNQQEENSKNQPEENSNLQTYIRAVKKKLFHGIFLYLLFKICPRHYKIQKLSMNCC